MSKIFRRSRLKHRGLIPPTCSECGHLLGLLKGGFGCPGCERKKREKAMVDQKQIKVPEGMLAAALDATTGGLSIPESSILTCKTALEAALLWQRGHAPVPTKEQSQAIYEAVSKPDSSTWINPDTGCMTEFAAEWIRHMYDAPELEAPPEENFDNVFMFGAILERPATTADNPSYRETVRGLRETVTCVRAEAYAKLLAAYHRIQQSK
jgi:hypothetical protein